MKLRRILSATALTAAVAPLTLLGATAAHATDDGPSPSPSPSAPSASPAPSATEPPAPCNNGPSTMVSVSLKGLPDEIKAGGGWHTFTLDVANKTGTALGAVEASVTANNGSPSENGDLFEHAWLEFWDAGEGKWMSLEDQGRNDVRDTGIIFGFTDLDAKESATLKFRLRVDAGATPGPSYAGGGATYVDPEEGCTDGTTTPSANFDVLAPGQEGGGGSETSPATEPGAAPDGTKPQGGASKPADGGSGESGEKLAETGSSSATTAVAAAGALAVVAGAGTVLVVRRRRGGAASA